MMRLAGQMLIHYCHGIFGLMDLSNIWIHNWM